MKKLIPGVSEAAKIEIGEISRSEYP